MVLKYTNLLFSKKFVSKKNYIFHKNFKNKLNPLFLKGEKWLYYSMILFVGVNVRAYRLLLGYPTRGQRTWSNAKTNRNLNSIIFNLKFNKFSKFNSSITSTKSIFLAEYINLFWQRQWFLEWFSVYKKLQYTPLHMKRNNLIDINSVLNFNINHNYKYNVNQKKKSHKRKRLFPKNKVSTGVPFFFSSIYKSNLTKL